jgi:Transcriptional accessory protein
MEKNIQLIAAELKLKPQQVEVVINLLAEGATIPFMARYRKELTGSLDEVVLTSIRDRHEQLSELDKRKEAILKSIEKQEKLTPALAKAIDEATTLAELEDIYLPYKPKRKTRASVAKEKGLEPLALSIFEQGKINVEETAATYINTALGVATAQEHSKARATSWRSGSAKIRKREKIFVSCSGTMESSRPV